MKLTAKIMSLIFIVIIMLLIINGYFSIRREIKLFDKDMKRDTHLLGVAIKELVINSWKHNTPEQVYKLIDNINKSEQQVLIRLVWFDAAKGDPHEPRISAENLEPVIHGQEFSLYKKDQYGAGYFYTYVPLQIDNEKPGALELSEVLSDRTNYIHESIIRLLILVGLMLLMSALLLLYLGTKMIGYPLSQLVEKTRKIGSGDLAHDIILHRHDELSDLASAMNQMCKKLEEAQEAVRQETNKRITALEQLRHAERLATLGKLSSGIAHEMGTPLNVILGRAKLIFTGDLNKEEISESSKIILEQTERMTKIIQQFLYYARRRVVHRTKVNIHKLIKQVIEMLKPIANKSKVNFDLVENSSMAPFFLDQAQIQQVLINIIMNGIQAMPDGGKLRIKLDLENDCSLLNKKGKKNKFLTISICDEGIGISNEDMNEIFEPFFTTKATGKGTGLGLSIVKGIVDEHNGLIDVKSKQGDGTSFKIYLPMEEVK